MSDIQEEQKRLYKKAEENDKNINDIPLLIDDEKIKEIYGGDYKKALVEVGKNERKYILKYKLLQERINKAVKFIGNPLDNYWTEEAKELVNILKGDDDNV